MDRFYGWQRFYEDAVLETNRAELVRRIQAAEAAIHARMAQLQSNHTNGAEERHAIEDALAGLGLLRREAVTQHSSARTDARR